MSEVSEVKDYFERIAASIEVTIMHGVNTASSLRSLRRCREKLVMIEFFYPENGYHQTAISVREKLDDAIEKICKGNLQDGQIKLARARHRLI